MSRKLSFFLIAISCLFFVGSIPAADAGSESCPLTGKFVYKIRARGTNAGIANITVENKIDEDGREIVWVDQYYKIKVLWVKRKIWMQAKLDAKTLKPIWEYRRETVNDFDEIITYGADNKTAEICYVEREDSESSKRSRSDDPSGCYTVDLPEKTYGYSALPQTAPCVDPGDGYGYLLSPRGIVRSKMETRNIDGFCSIFDDQEEALYEFLSTPQEIDAFEWLPKRLKDDATYHLMKMHVSLDTDIPVHQWAESEGDPFELIFEEYTPDF